MLWHKDRAPWIAVTGGKRPGDHFTEAGVSATYLEAHGVPAAKILKGSGTDTWQNVATVLPKLKAHDITTVLTVTDPFHEDRAMAISSSQGLTPYPSPVRNSPTVKHSLWKYYLKETFEVGVGRIIGYQRVPLVVRLTEASLGAGDIFGISGRLSKPFGGGVIGNTTGSGPVIQGSSPCPRANETELLTPFRSWSHRLVA